METLANWEGEWTTSHPQHAEPSCCFNSAPGEEIFQPDQLIISQLPAHSVDQLLTADGLVSHLETTSHCDLRGQTFDCYPETSPPASADSHQSLWSLPPAGSSCISSRFQHKSLPHPQIHTHDSFKKRKRDWNPDPDPKRHFTLLGSGSGYEQYGYTSSGTFKLISETKSWSSSTLSFQQGGAGESTRREEEGDVDAEAIQQMKEMMYRAAALRPVNLGAEVVEKPRRKNVRISSDPQTVAARQRRERISERLRVLQKLVPGGCKMDTASMLDEAANYLKFLRSQVKALEAMPPPSATPPATTSTSISISSSPSLNSHFSANQMTPGVGTFNMANCFPTYYFNSNSNDDRNDDDDDHGGGRISMISYHPIPIPIAAMRHNPTSNPPFLLQQYAKS